MIISPKIVLALISDQPADSPDALQLAYECAEALVDGELLAVRFVEDDLIARCARGGGGWSHLTANQSGTLLSK